MIVTLLSPETAEMATIRQRGTRWQCIVKRTGHPTLSKTFDLKKDSEKWGRQQERLIDLGQWVDQTAAHETTLHELLTRYATEVSPTKRGCKAELYRIEQLKRSALSKYSPASVTGQMIAQWRDARLKEVSSGTVLRDLLMLSHLFTIAIREWGTPLPANPVSLIRKPSPGRSRDRVLTDVQRHCLVAECAKCQNPWIQPAVVFALETAARRGEILSLMWDAVDLQRSIAKVSGKTGERTLPLSSACIAMLERIPKSLDGRVFPLTAETLKQAYERAVARAGITNFTFHDLRHDALTRLAKLGLSVLELRAISGHTSANMLQRYVSIDAEELAIKLRHPLQSALTSASS